MRTDQKVIDYYKKLGIYDSKFTDEAVLLKHAIEFLEMLPATKIARIEAGTKGGISDILACYQGLFVAIELKDDIGVPSAQQSKFIQDVRKAGGRGGVCRTLEEIHITLTGISGMQMFASK